MRVYLGDIVELINTDHPGLESFKIGDKFVVVGADSHNDGSVYLYLKNSNDEYVDRIPVKYVQCIPDNDTVVH